MNGIGIIGGILQKPRVSSSIEGKGIEIIVWVDGYLGMLADDGGDDTGNDILCDVCFIE